MKPLRANSKTERLLAHLSRGHSITSMQAIRRWRMTRLAARIEELEDRGHAIDREPVSRNGARFMRYWLHAQPAPLAKGRGGR